MDEDDISDVVDSDNTVQRPQSKGRPVASSGSRQARRRSADEAAADYRENDSDALAKPSPSRLLAKRASDSAAVPALPPFINSRFAFMPVVLRFVPEGQSCKLIHPAPVLNTYQCKHNLLLDSLSPLNSTLLPL